MKKRVLKKRFVIPIIAEGCPRPAILAQGCILWTEGDATCEIVGKSGYAPLLKLNREYVNEEGYSYIPIKKAISFIEERNGVWVKENFDEYNIEDLKEIKEKLPEKWVNLFNDFLASR